MRKKQLKLNFKIFSQENFHIFPCFFVIISNTFLLLFLQGFLWYNNQNYFITSNYVPSNIDKQIPEPKLTQSTGLTTKNETSETTVRNLLSLNFYNLSYIKCILVFFRRPIFN